MIQNIMRCSKCGEVILSQLSKVFFSYLVTEHFRHFPVSAQWC